MEDSGEMQTEENKVSLDVNKKRVVKTQAQVLALENFYRENKFPSDEMKAQIAAQIRLSEKQISSWFCHRRLKDKRRDEPYANGRQDHSSGVIQDRGSGLRQDSCGSIKQGDYRNIDLREVESRRIYGHEFPAADLSYERRSHQNPHDAHVEDTSSESSLSLQDQHFSEGRDLYDMQISANLAHNGAIKQINPRSAKSMSHKPSGYLKVKSEIENLAITSVKRQLGRHYREDGPLLGTAFDPLPPVAFEFPRSNPVNGPYLGDPIQGHDPNISGVIRQPNFNTINEVHNSQMSSQDPCMEGANLNTLPGSERQDRKSHHQLNYRASFPCSKPFPSQKSSLDIYEGSSGKTTGSNCKWNRTSSKTALERMGSDSFSNHPAPHGVKIANEQEKPRLHNDNNQGYKYENLSKTSSLIRGRSESPITERGPSAMMSKVEKLGGERKPKRENPVRVKIEPTNELRVARGVNVETSKPDFLANASHARLPSLTNPTKGSSMDVPSSFTEDETAETSSSLD